MGREILEGLGYKVTATNSSREAMRLFTADPSRYDLIVTDQTMPEITGIDLARQAREVRADIPVILCTGYSYMVDAEIARVAGVTAFATKPLTKKELGNMVRKALDG